MTLMGKRVVTTVKTKIRLLQRVHTFICARKKTIGDNYKAFFREYTHFLEGRTLKDEKKNVKDACNQVVQ